MAKKDVNNMSFLDHLEELRWHIIKAVISVFIFTIIAFICKDIIVGIIMAPKKMDFPTYVVLCHVSKFFGMDMTFCAQELPFEIIVTDISAQFTAHIWTSVFAGLIVAFPYVLYQMWAFISPGLESKERKGSRGFIVVSSFLFFLGILFGYYVITPLSLNFLTNYTFSEEVSNKTNLSSYISIVRSTSLACGLVFELPIIVYFLTKIGLVTPQVLKKYRKFALVAVLILAAIITPPDVASQIIVAIPILILYQLSIFISGIVLRREKKKQKNLVNS